MKIRIARAGEDIGEFEAAEIPNLRVAGIIQNDDYYWTDGMVDWLPVTTLAIKEADPTVPVMAAASAAPAQEPTGGELGAGCCFLVLLAVCAFVALIVIGGCHVTLLR